MPDIEHLSSATRAATRIATSLGGYAQSVDYTTPHGGNGTAAIELRVPAQNVQRALERLAGLGTLVSQNVSVKDLQHALQVQSEQIAQLRRRVAALHTALADPALPDAQRVLLQIKLAESKRALAQRLNARNGNGDRGHDRADLARPRHRDVDRHAGASPRPDRAGCSTPRSASSALEAIDRALRSDRDQPVRPARRARRGRSAGRGAAGTKNACWSHRAPSGPADLME